jgi:hypothetical protein
MSGSPKMDALREQREARAAGRRGDTPTKAELERLLVSRDVVATRAPVVTTPAPLPSPVVATCPECAKRRAAKAAAQARFRAKAKAGTPS